MSNECKHGQLARQCELCEKDRRIAELETALRFYSDARRWAGKDHYSSPSQDFPAWTDQSAAEKDRGDIARKALGVKLPVL